MTVDLAFAEYRAATENLFRGQYTVERLNAQAAAAALALEDLRAQASNAYGQLLETIAAEVQAVNPVEG